MAIHGRQEQVMNKHLRLYTQDYFISEIKARKKHAGKK